MSLGSTYWAARFARWAPAEPVTPGYSLLLPVPGDLPVFLELALAVCHLQEHEYRVETIIVPDRPSAQIDAVVERHRPTWNGPLRTALFPRPERRLLPLLQNPFHNYGIQLVTGTQAARGSHVLLHDADLFLLQDGILDEHYHATRDGEFHVRGVNDVWDSWFADRGLSLAATWELCASRDWLRSFPPNLHMAHVAELGGEEHSFDITLHPQALTDPRRIGKRPEDDAIVHFNHVIGSYRGFRSTRGTFADHNFRILLIRLFVDLFADVEADYALPTLAELADCLHRSDGPVSYPAPGDDGTYIEFRTKLDRILTGRWAPASRANRATEALAAFDAAYDWAPRTSDAPRPPGLATTPLCRPVPGADRAAPTARGSYGERAHGASSSIETASADTESQLSGPGAG